MPHPSSAASTSTSKRLAAPVMRPHVPERPGKLGEFLENLGLGVCPGH
jgi:hypothetical protein